MSSSSNAHNIIVKLASMMTSHQATENKEHFD